MNTLEDLRAVLEREAAFDDIDAPARPAAVRQRIRKARRRRAATVAAVVAAALVGASAAVGALRGPQAPEPAGPTLGDVHVPERVDVLGFPYGLEDVQPAADDGSLAFDEAHGAEDRVVTLVATGLGSGVATLWLGSQAVARVHGDEQLSAPVPVGGLSALRVRLDDTASGARAGVALYGPTGELAPGMAGNGVVFRQRLEDLELVAATFGSARREARLDLPASVEGLTASAYCHSEATGLWLHEAYDSGFDRSWRCADFDSGDDPGWMNRYTLRGPRPGEQTFTAYVTQGEDGPRATDADVAFGIAIYRPSIAPTSVLGHDVPTVLENSSRAWRLDDVVDPRGADEYEVDTASGDVLLVWATDGATAGDLSWRGAYDHSSTSFSGTDPSSGTLTAGILLGGDRYDVRMRLDGPDPDSRLVLYRPE